MLPKKNYYLNDYFDIYKSPYIKEKEYMKTDIYELNNKYILEIDLPGIDKNNIKIIYENGYLTISVEKQQLSINSNNYIRRERFFGEIKRSFYIGLKNVAELKANYVNGVLTISFPKADLPKTDINNIKIS